MTAVLAAATLGTAAQAEAIDETVTISVNVPRSFFVHIVDNKPFEFALTEGCGVDGTDPCLEGDGYVDFAVYGNASEETRVSIGPPADRTETRSGVDFGIFEYTSGFVEDAPPIYYFPLFARWRITNQQYRSGQYPETIDIGGNRYQQFEVVSPSETSMQTFINWNPTRSRRVRLHNRSYELYRLWVQPLFDDQNPIESFADIAPGEYRADVIVSIIPPS